jgi:hypothetical protein
MRGFETSGQFDPNSVLGACVVRKGTARELFYGQHNDQDDDLERYSYIDVRNSMDSNSEGKKVGQNCAPNTIFKEH